MNHDEFAFFNQQLAAMVRDGIPLEGAMKHLCAEMRQGALRTELEKLSDDLSKGVPLRDAVKPRHLPDLYRQMLEVGAQSNDLPAVLTLLADHYQRQQVISTRLKGLMVYPAIVLVSALILSCFLAFMLSSSFFGTFGTDSFGWFYPSIGSRAFLAPVWAAPLLLVLAVVAMVVAVTSSRARRFLRWRMPAFKEASLAQVAAALSLMLKRGVPLDKALGLVEQLEQGTPAAGEMARWRQRLAGGRGKLSEMAEEGFVFPPLFVWMVGQSGEDLASGFQRAAEIYQSRAAYRADVLLYSALPCSVILLGIMILSEIQPITAALISFMNMLSQFN